MSFEKKKFDFCISPRFEIFFGIQNILDPDMKTHLAWKQKASGQLSKEFFTNAEILGGSHEIWPIIADVLKIQPGNLSFIEIIRVLGSTGAKDLQREIIHGAIHNDKIASEVLSGRKSLKDALNKVPKAKQDWLTFIGLYPYREEAPIVRALSLLTEQPEVFRSGIVTCLEVFWKDVFKKTWNQIQTQLVLSSEQNYRLFCTLPLADFAEKALLRIEVSEKNQVLRAARGGFELAFKDIGRGFFLPSAFNEKRFWSAYETNNGTDIYFPYFDPSISITAAAESQSDISPELDAFLICKALGDSTRFAIVLLLSKNKMRAADIAAELKISKPTVSHHVHVLRDAGLLSAEQSLQQPGSQLLTLRRKVFESLGEVLCKRLF